MINLYIKQKCLEFFHWETSDKPLLSSPPALPRGRRAFSGDPITKNLNWNKALLNGRPKGCPRREHAWLAVYLAESGQGRHEFYNLNDIFWITCGKKWCHFILYYCIRTFRKLYLQCEKILFKNIRGLFSNTCADSLFG